jgi:hypothetical protein
MREKYPRPSCLPARSRSSSRLMSSRGWGSFRHAWQISKRKHCAMSVWMSLSATSSVSTAFTRVATALMSEQSITCSVSPHLSCTRGRAPSSRTHIDAYVSRWEAAECSIWSRSASYFLSLQTKLVGRRGDPLPRPGKRDSGGIWIFEWCRWERPISFPVPQLH